MISKSSGTPCVNNPQDRMGVDSVSRTTPHLHMRTARHMNRTSQDYFACNHAVAAPPGRCIWLISTRHPRWPSQIIEQEDIEAVISHFADTQLRLCRRNASAALLVRRPPPRSPALSLDRIPRGL